MLIEFVLPGDPRTPTGGYRYDARLVEGLRAGGHTVRLTSLSERFPQPDERALAQARQVFAAFADHSLVLVDGLAYGALPDVIRPHARRLRLVALVHHPLAFETGLSERQAARLARSEREALDHARHVIVTSGTTAQSLADYGVSADRVTVAEPGIDECPLATASRDGAVAMLYVASLTARKGHLLLIDALERVQARSPLRWHLTCAGPLDRDAATTARVTERLRASTIGQRVTLAGALDEPRLDALYGASDLYVSASSWEGYGMAAAQAIACGLPVVMTSAGALDRTVPEQASLRVPTGDVAGLADALLRFLEEPALREQLRQGARDARAGLPRWPATISRVEALLQRLPAR